MRERLKYEQIKKDSGASLRNFPDRDINEIAWQCGFTDIPYFNRYFKKMKRMTPGQWRNAPTPHRHP